MNRTNKLTFLLMLALMCIIINGNISAQEEIISKIKNELSSDFFNRLYSDTYYNLISRIDDDGYIQESMTGHYDGMYCRTVGALVPLLIETGDTENAELLLNFVIGTMKSMDMSRVPHVIGKHKTGAKDSVYIIGKTDQIDGQAHFILAWARLALYRGNTAFEDTTWNFISGLMNRSTEPPYFNSDMDGFIPNLIYNFNFEHSRAVPSNYDLLTQCFVGSALESMIKVAERRNDDTNIFRWEKRLRQLKKGVEDYFTRIVDGKKIYLELLYKDENGNKPFHGFSWVNLSPAAALWEPLGHDVFVNTVKAMRKNIIRRWNDIKWMPTQTEADGSFSGQIIGKGIGWEIEFCRKEKDWNRILEIFSMLEVIQNNESIFMENSYLTSGGNRAFEKMTDEDLLKHENGIWKIVDAGNGEQAAWWCWAMSRLRKEAGLTGIPVKLIVPPIIKIADEDLYTAQVEITSEVNAEIFYTIDGDKPSRESKKYEGKIQVEKPAKITAAVYCNEEMSNFATLSISSKYSGIEFNFFGDPENSNLSSLREKEPTATGFFRDVNLPKFYEYENKRGISENGFIKIDREGEYKFYLITESNSSLQIDGHMVTLKNSSGKENDFNEPIYLLKGYHKIKFLSDYTDGGGSIEIYYSINNGKRERLDPNMLLVKVPGDISLPPPRIMPVIPEFDKDDRLLISITSFDDADIFYTLDGSEPDENSLKYISPFELNTSSVVKSVLKRGIVFSGVSIMKYTQTERIKIDFRNKPSPKYGGNGYVSLIDGIYGDINIGGGNWLGFEGEDFDVELNLRKVKSINKIGIEFLSAEGSWIFLPAEVKIFISSDGTNFEKVFSESIALTADSKPGSEIKLFEADLNNRPVQYIRVIARNIGVCPEWHPGDGNKAWLFTDEIFWE